MSGLFGHLVKTFTDVNCIKKLTLNYSWSGTVLLNPKPKNIGPLAGKVRGIEKKIKWQYQTLVLQREELVVLPRGGQTGPRGEPVPCGSGLVRDVFTKLSGRAGAKALGNRPRLDSILTKLSEISSPGISPSLYDSTSTSNLNCLLQPHLIEITHRRDQHNPSGHSHHNIAALRNSMIRPETQPREKAKMVSLLKSLVDPRKNWFTRQHMKVVSQRLCHYDPEPSQAEMKVVAAYLLAVLGGKTTPTSEDLKDILPLVLRLMMIGFNFCFPKSRVTTSQS
ncbi:unnamed protein product [Malus baccata var. baccata]